MFKKFVVKMIQFFQLNHLINDIRNIFGTFPFKYSLMDYNKYWIERDDDNFYQPRFPLMVSEIEDNSSVLDVGCGDGAFLNYLKLHKNNIEEFGIDISETGIEKARRKNINSKVRKLDYYNNDCEIFDYVIMSEVIEHVPNSEYFVTKGFELAKKALIVTIPNTGYYTHRIRLLLGEFPVQWVHHPAEHLRFWTIKDFKKWLNSIDILQDKYNLTIVPSNGLPYLALYKIFPSIFCKQVIYVIEKKT